ncbi:CD209 antigen-like protein E [Sciurus carolinensis]|uniref:CD209 antigen-like protein E n=1 Tax=Sciurus carolinensis TaxID=30640 RepID=UPI001FB2ABAE|nr:CD209 antigen-like protein E [Sciurus carolinensis]
MSDFKEARVQQLDPLEEELMASGTRYSVRDYGFPLPSRGGGFAGCLSSNYFLLMLQLLSLTILAGLLMAVLVQVSKAPGSQEQEQELSKQKVYQELTQLKVGVDRLCRPCPWDWTFFQGNCYFFSKSQRNWHDSVTACQEEGAQLVIIKSAEEQSFLQQTSKNKGSTWMGLSDQNQEATWHWVDGSPLSRSFKYWNPGEPNNVGEEDCAEFTGDGWNDAKCDTEKFWVCKNSTASCSHT